MASTVGELQDLDALRVWEFDVADLRDSGIVDRAHREAWQMFVAQHWARLLSIQVATPSEAWQTVMNRAIAERT